MLDWSECANFFRTQILTRIMLLCIDEGMKEEWTRNPDKSETPKRYSGKRVPNNRKNFPLKKCLGRKRFLLTNLKIVCLSIEDNDRKITLQKFHRFYLFVGESRVSWWLIEQEEKVQILVPGSLLLLLQTWAQRLQPQAAWLHLQTNFDWQFWATSRLLGLRPLDT